MQESLRARAATRAYLSPQQAGEYLNLSPRTLEKMRSDGGGPTFRKLGKRIRYTQVDLDAWAQARACESTFDPAYGALRLTGMPRAQRRPPA